MLSSRSEGPILRFAYNTLQRGMHQFTTVRVPVSLSQESCNCQTERPTVADGTQLKPCLAKACR